MYKLVSIIKETSTGRKLFTVQRDEDLTLRDIDFDKLVKCAHEVDNITVEDGKLTKATGVKFIEVSSLSNTGGKLVPGFNDLETFCFKNDKIQHLINFKLANPTLDTKEIARGSNEEYTVVCPKCGREQTIKLNVYTGKKNACICEAANLPYCEEGINDLVTVCNRMGLQSMLEEYADERDIKTISAGSHKKVHWKCRFGHEWDAAPGARIGKSEGCPYCTGAQTSRAERITCEWLEEHGVRIIRREKIQGQEFDIHIPDYKILLEFNSELTHSSDESIRKDQLKHEIANSLQEKLIVIHQGSTSDQLNLYRDIEFNVNRKDSMQNMIKDLEAKLAEYGLKIETNISKKAVANANKNSVPYERSFLGVYDGIEDIWGESNAVTPDRMFANTRKMIYLNCPTHGEYQLRGDAVKQSWNKSGKGCPYCKGIKVFEGDNDLLSNEPEISLDWSPNNELKPNEVTTYSNKKVEWICHTCGYTWEAMINARTGVNRTGCPRCNKHIVYR